MRRTIHTCLLLIAFAGLLAAPLAAAGQPSAKQLDKRLVLSNDDITVWIEGNKPLLKVFSSATSGAKDGADAASPAFTFHADQLVEYRDVNGDGVPADDEVLARADLTDASAWHVNVTTTSDAATANFSFDGPVKLQRTPQGLLDNVTGMLPSEGNAKLALTFTVHASPSVAGVLSLPRGAVDAQLSVLQWPWADAQNDRLALDASATGKAARNVTAGVGTVALSTNGTQAGDIAWSTAAHGTTTAGTAIDVPVRDVEQADANGTTRLVLTYDAPSVATVQHDAGLSLASASITPLGVGTVLGASTSKASPGAGVALTVGALAAVAAVVAWRRR
jgi:hypothetical protein